MVATNLHSILANQTNVTLARNQRIVASWLPPPSPGEQGQAQNGLELDEEDGHAFVPELELYGPSQKYLTVLAADQLVKPWIGAAAAQGCGIRASEQFLNRREVAEAIAGSKS